MPRPSPLISAFDAALAWFRERVPMTDSQAKADMDAAREQAFWVTGAAHMGLVQQAWDGIDAAVESGESLDDFKRRVGESLRAAWGASEAAAAARLETIFRTNVQRSFMAGRHAEQTRPEVLEARPYWRAVAILDGRQTEVCNAIHGVVLPADHPFWATHWPPLHFNCRTTVTTLTEAQAKAKGITKRPPRHPAADGFGATPAAAPWKPELDDVPKPIAKVYKAKTGKRRR